MGFSTFVILGIAFGIQLLMPKAPARRGLLGILVFLAAILFVFGLASYQSWLQYQAWESNELTKLFLPPHQNWDYFVFYVRTRFFNPYLLSLFFSLLFLGTAQKLNQKYQERFFEPVEPYLFTLSIFLTGHPLWLFYLILLLIIFLIVNILITNYYILITHKEMPRISLYYFWLPAAISTILISKWLAMFSWWQLLKF